MEIDFAYNTAAWLNFFDELDWDDLSSYDESRTNTLREAFETFLGRFPLVYAIWAKFADFSYLTTGDFNTARSVFERALSGPLGCSVEMWGDFIGFCKGQPQTLVGGVEDILVEALDSIGWHYRSEPLWKELLSCYEQMDYKWCVVCVKAISYPISNVVGLWQEFQKVLPRLPISFIYEIDPAKRLRELLDAQPTPQLGDETELRGEAVRRITEIFDATHKRVKEIELFEDRIQRHFFHFQAPDEFQIWNWQEYAKYCENKFAQNQNEQNFEDVVHVYERALIPCAYIDSIYQDYAAFLERTPSFGGYKAADEILQRGDENITPNIPIWRGELNEVYNPEKAEEIYKHLALSNVADVILAVSGYWMRREDPQMSYQVLQDAYQRLIEANDSNGAGILYKAILQHPNKEGEVPEPPMSALAYLALIQSRKEHNEDATELFYRACFEDTTVPFEDRAELAGMYLEYLYITGNAASYLVDIENLVSVMKHKSNWHREYFEQAFLFHQGNECQPEDQLKRWLEYQSENVQ